MKRAAVVLSFAVSLSACSGSDDDDLTQERDGGRGHEDGGNAGGDGHLDAGTGPLPGTPDMDATTDDDAGTEHDGSTPSDGGDGDSGTGPGTDAAPDDGSLAIDCTSAGPNIFYALGSVASQPLTLTGKQSQVVITPAVNSVGEMFVARYDEANCFDYAMRVSGASGGRFALANDSSVYLATTGSNKVTTVSSSVTDSPIQVFDPTNEAPTQITGNDIILSKFDSSGKLAWSRRMGQIDQTNTLRMNVEEVISTNEDVRVIGFLNFVSGAGSHDFVFGPGEANQQTVTVPDNVLWSFEARFSADTGEFIADSLDTLRASSSASPHGGRFYGRGNGVPGDGDEYPLGIWADATSGTAYDLTLGGNLSHFSTVGSAGNAVMMVVNPDRTIRWQRQIQQGSATNNAFALSNYESVWTGSVSLASAGTVNFPGSDSDTPIVMGAQDPFIVRYTEDGEVAWVKTIAATNMQALGVIAMTADQWHGQKIIVTGLAVPSTTGTTHSALFGKGEENETTVTFTEASTFIAAFELFSGEFSWISVIRNPSYYPVFDQLRISYDEVNVTARVDGTTTFDVGGPNETVIDDAHGYQEGVARYGFDGSFHGFGTLATYGTQLGGISQVEVIWVD